MAKLFNRAKMKTTTTGSGTVTLTTASDGYQTFAAAGVVDSDVVQYVIEDGTSWEIGTGTYSATGTSLTRSPTESSNAGAAISLTGAAEVFITAVAADLNRLQDAGSTKVEATSTGATVTGNIVVTGTVDGRDVAADGAKLDGIEAGATADQTKADIDALGINADQVDGLEASQFLRSDASDTASGSITFSNASGITIGEADLFHQTANTWRGITVKNNGDTTQVTIDGQSSDGTQRLSIYGETSSQGFLNPTDNSWKLRIPNTGSLLRDNTHTIWDSGNDGSGSGLDADTLDGVQGSSFLRSDAADTASGSLTFTGTTAFGTTATFSSSATAINFDASSTSDNRGIAFNGRTALSADYNDGWLRLNNAAEFTSGVYTGSALLVNGNLTVGNSTSSNIYMTDTDNTTRIIHCNSNQIGFLTSASAWGSYCDNSGNWYTPNLYVNDYIYHNGDTDTRIVFATDTITLQTAGSSEITVNTTGVRLGDTGNGYFQPVTGNYGSIQVDGGAHGGYEGYSIGGRAVFMHNNSTATGIYNDVENEWLFYGVHNGYTRLYYNGASKIETTSTGAAITGAITATGNITAYYSDERLKTKTGDLDGALEKIKKLNGFYYVENDLAKELGFTNDKQQVALSAQEVQSVMPEAVGLAPFDMDHDEEKGLKPDVSKSGENYLTVDYARLVPLLVEAIKEQQQQIDELKAKLEAL